MRVMSHYGGLPYAVGVLLFVAMCLILGLYGGLFALLVRWLRLGDGFARWLAVPLAWAAVEYLRTYFLTGFPWNLLAAAIVDYTSLIVISRAAGPYFVGAVIVVPSVLLAWLITQRPAGPRRVFILGGAAILGFVWWGTGFVAARVITKPTGAAPAMAALLQPNISQEMRWDEQNLIAIYRRMMQMTEDAASRGAQVVVWPESTVPLSYSSTEFYRRSIEELSSRRNIDIVLGSVAEDAEDEKKIWNSAFLVSGGKTIGHYDKIRLVPFGEYVPLRKMLFFAEKLVRAVGEFQFGTNDRPLAGKFSYGPAICYEVVFPQIARTQVRNGADVLVTITNDAWYDGTSAPEQHLQQARLRAVETNRYLLRSGTTGISAFIDPAGRVLSSLPMGKEGIVWARFQPRKTMTPYVRWGDWFAWGAWAAVIIVIGMKGRG
jgi:apolipoprotein N-acyltransferase